MVKVHEVNVVMIMEEVESSVWTILTKTCELDIHRMRQNFREQVMTLIKTDLDTVVKLVEKVA